MSDLTPTPEAVVDRNGRIQFGLFDQPFRRINMNDAARKSGPVPWPRAARRARLKEWQHFWIGNDAFYFGLAVVDAKHLKLSFASFVDRKTGQLVERICKNPLSSIRLPRELWNHRGHFRAKGYRAALHSDLDNGRFHGVLEAGKTKHTPRLKADFTLNAEPNRQPLVVVLPLGGNRGMYSHKTILPAEGEIEVGGKKYAFGASDTRCIVDVHKAHYPYRTWWRWSTFWGYTTDGREIGMNLTENVAKDAAVLNECVLWVDGAMTRLGEADIKCRPGAYLDTWNIGTRDGAVRLTFHPEGERFEDLNFGAVKSQFHQPYGTYKGTIELLGGETLEIDRGWGVAENHRCRW